jgi:hypothetical protein
MGSRRRIAFALCWTREKAKQYWINWKGFGPEHKQWVDENEMKAKDFVEAYETKDIFVCCGYVCR